MSRDSKIFGKLAWDCKKSEDCKLFSDTIKTILPLGYIFQ